MNTIHEKKNNKNNKTVAIRITDPRRTSALFGECAGDYSPDQCVYWVGKIDALYPSASIPKGAIPISAPVKHSGGIAWVEHNKFHHRIETQQHGIMFHACDGTWRKEMYARVKRGCKASTYCLGDTPHHRLP